MAERARGNIFYEILIVILIVGLIGTILYPSRVWKQEEELENTCRARMDAISQLEYNYISAHNTYSDSIAALRNELLSDSQRVAALDTLIFWDDLVRRDDLKMLVLARQFPEDLENFILRQLEGQKSLGNLIIWDSLGYRLWSRLNEILNEPDFAEDQSFDENISWVELVGEDVFWKILENQDIPRSIRNRTRSSVTRGIEIQQTAGWERFRPAFYEELQKTVSNALREDVWTKAQEDDWTVERRKLWEAEIDALSPVEQDSIWLDFQQRLWDRDKELIWKRERNRLWKQEGADWVEENTAVWKRSIVQKWTTDRKKEWESETLSSLPDSLVGAFAAEKDSLWKDVVDSLQALEYENWEQSNQKFVDETVRNIWESERRVSWEVSAREVWLEEKEADKEELWREIKEELWKSESPRLWREEELKLARKNNAQRRLDRSVGWMNVLGMDVVNTIVSQLQLPNTQGMWKEINHRIKEKTKIVGGGKRTAVLNDIGISGLFRNALLDSISKCPLANQLYLIGVIDTTAIKRFTIHCPIVDTAKTKIALKVDPVTKDTSEIALQLSGIQKIFGGGTLKSHGHIDEDGKKSWDKRGS